MRRALRARSISLFLESQATSSLRFAALSLGDMARGAVALSAVALSAVALSAVALGAVALSAVALSAVGCVGYYPSGSSTPFRASPLLADGAKGFKPSSVYSIAVLPLSNVTVEDAVVTPLADDLLAQLTGELVQSFQVITSYDLVNASRPKQLAEALQKQALLNPSRTIQTQAVELGKSVGADAVLSGVITRFQESDGSRLGARQSSGVGFRLWLTRVQDSSVLWTATFEKADQPLTDNLFRVGEVMRDGVGFKTSDELAKQGFRDAARELERLKQVPG